MRLLGNFVVMYDEVTVCFQRRVKNRYIAMTFCLIQLIISSVSLAQHVYSVLNYRKIFSCQFKAIYRNDSGRFLAYDIVIFDFGLFNFLLGVDECVANYLDGGYMRCMWCVSHVVSLLGLLYILLAEIRWSYVMCPILLQQSVYSLGLIILTIATLPKLLNAFVNRFGLRFVKVISIYFVGMGATWFFTFTIWHYYWYLDRIENEEKARLKMGSCKNGEDANDELLFEQTIEFVTQENDVLERSDDLSNNEQLVENMAYLEDAPNDQLSLAEDQITLNYDQI